MAKGSMDIRKRQGAYLIFADATSDDLQSIFDDFVNRESYDSREDAVNAATEEATVLVGEGSATEISISVEDRLHSVIKKQRRR